MSYRILTLRGFAGLLAGSCGEDRAYVDEGDCMGTDVITLAAATWTTP